MDKDTGENVHIPTNPNNPDTDGDGILDPDDPFPWVFGDTIPGETGNGGGNQPNPGPPIPPEENKDTDKDGILDHYEFQYGTDYRNPDTDGDNLNDWDELREQVKKNGMRNGYLMAIAPTSSISILVGTTQAIEPVPQTNKKKIQAS